MNAPVRRVLPPVWLAMGLIASYLLDRWLPIANILRDPWTDAGVVPIVLGGVIAINSALGFRRVGTAVRPFEPSTTLVTTGFYRFTRNPMYLGLTLVLLGVGVMHGSVGALLPVPAFMALIEWRFIRGEEQFLDGIFGSQYRDYRSRVRRWL
jgi:protein-S-isoprenylcysteine O-methyltransferase Ste14